MSTAQQQCEVAHTLTLRRVGIDTYQEAVVYMNRDCHVCRAEGFSAQSRLEVGVGSRRLIATLNFVSSELLRDGEASLSESAWQALDAREGDELTVAHPEPLESLSSLRAKVYGQRLPAEAWRAVIADVAAGRYSNLHLAALVTACAGDRLDLDETIALTRAMVESGERLTWPDATVVDKASHLKMGLTPVLIDDIVSSARTMIETVRQLRAAGSAPPTCVAVHGVFAAGAYEALREAGAAEIVTTNSIAHASNGIDLCAALVEPVKRQWSKASAL